MLINQKPLSKGLSEGVETLNDMNSSPSQIKVCGRHDKVIPLLFTFAFNRYEYWCPYCGANYGFGGSKKTVDETPELMEDREEWENRAEDFLHAKCVQVCISLEWEGKEIRPHDLPRKEKDRLAEIIEDWQYDIHKENP